MRWAGQTASHIVRCRPKAPKGHKAAKITPNTVLVILGVQALVEPKIGFLTRQAVETLPASFFAPRLDSLRQLFTLRFWQKG